jgi:hypothetical protein
MLRRIVTVLSSTARSLFGRTFPAFGHDEGAVASGRHRTRFSLFATIAGAVCLTSTYCTAETLNELKGLSIQLSFNVLRSARIRPDRSRESTHDEYLKIYVSNLGKLFEYVDSQGPLSKYSLNTYVNIDKAAEFRSGQMYTWTMIDGHLTKIKQLKEGFHVLTIVVDVKNLGCAFTMRNEPDSKTGRVISPLGIDIIADTVLSYQCRVTRGNIFATEQ